jgi:superfamily II DNA or RNA helicase
MNHAPDTRCDVATRKSPRPHQGGALRALCTELVTAERATAVLPCGTGKTLIASWLAEAHPPP